MKRRIIKTPKGNFRTLKEAGKVFDITKQAIKQRIDSDNSKWSGFSYGEVEATPKQAEKINKIVNRAKSMNYKFKVADKWKPLEIEGQKLLISDGGQICRERLIGNMTINQLMPLTKSKTGYVSLGITVNGKTKRFYVHRLVGLAFIPNPDHKPQINHKDLDKSNNDVSNLEWCTASENINHYHDNKVISLVDRKLAGSVDVI